ncbi:hypothetical protein [Brachybacterium kimchii]|uniref:Resolvase HTH domain-containing protein n=1 Tax=Brachybacterium kimchii TaxID=2942909 RepID=A0ABY4ND71_9MICO|nr:hypothetical protein [Brachybacterium kimchii]UQN31520.1 hypothetical protein M4486_09700 [Brachybacterium kimchii]
MARRGRGLQDVESGELDGRRLGVLLRQLDDDPQPELVPRIVDHLVAKRRRGERVGGRKPTHTPEQVARAMRLFDTTELTGQEIANAVGMGRSRMYALIAREKAAQGA